VFYIHNKGDFVKKLILLSCIALTACVSIVDGGPDVVNLMTSDGSRVQAQVNSKFGMQQVFLPSLITVPKSCSDITVQVLEDVMYIRQMPLCNLMLIRGCLEIFSLVA